MDHGTPGRNRGTREGHRALRKEKLQCSFTAARSHEAPAREKNATQCDIANFSETATPRKIENYLKIMCRKHYIPKIENSH